MPARAFAPSIPTASAVIGVLASIERRAPTDPAVIAFRGALVRMGREAREAGGPAAVRGLVREVAATDPARAATRGAVLRGAWGSTRGARGGVAVRQHRHDREVCAAA